MDGACSMNRDFDHSFDKPTRVADLFHSRHGFWTWDLEAERINLDEHCCRILGLPPEAGTMAQEAWLRRIHARDLLQVMPGIETAIHAGGAYRVEYSVLNAAKQWIWLETHGRVVEWRDGLPILAAGVHSDITERVRAEQALAVNLARQRALIDSLPDLIFVIDCDGLISEYYPPANSAIVYPVPAEYLGRSYFAVFPEDIAHFITDSFLQLVEDPTPLSADMAMQITGADREFHITLNLLTDSRNWPAGFLCVARDITERKRLEQALTCSEERLALVLQGSGAAAWDWDLLNQAFWHAPRWWNMLGHAAEGSSRDPDLWCRFMHPEDVRRARQALELALADAGNDSFATDFRLCHRAGHYLRVLAHGYIQRDSKGKPVRVSGTNMDITRFTGHALESR